MHITFVLFLPFIQIEFRPRKDVLPAAAQRQKFQAQHAQCIIQVAAELAAFHPRRQVHTAGDDHPDVGSYRTVGAVVQELSLQQVEQLILHLERQVLHVAQIKGAILRQFRHTGRGLLFGGIVAEQHGIQRIGQPGAAIQRNECIVAGKAFVVQALRHDIFPGARLPSQQYGCIVFCDPLGQRNRRLYLLVARLCLIEGILGDVTALIQLPAQFPVHLDDPLALLEGQDCAVDLPIHADRRQVDNRYFMFDVHQEGVRLFPLKEGILQDLTVEVGKNGGQRLSQQIAGTPLQQIISRAVNPQDDPIAVDLHDPIEGVVQHGVHLGVVVFFQINGVTDASGSFQSRPEALLPRRDEPAGHPHMARMFAGDISPNHRIAAILISLFGGRGQPGGVLHHIKAQINTEQLVELGGIAEHIGKTDQPKPWTCNPQLPFQIEHHHPQFLGGHTDLDQRHTQIAAFDDLCLCAAGHDQFAALAFQLPHAGFDQFRSGEFQTHHRKMFGCSFSQRARQLAHLPIRDQNRHFCHRDSPFPVVGFWNHFTPSARRLSTCTGRRKKPGAEHPAFRWLGGPTL